MKVSKDFKSTKEAAELLGVSEKTIYNFIKSGHLKPNRIGGVKKAGRTFIHIDQIKRLRGE